MKVIFNKTTICEAAAPLMSGVSSKVTLAAAEGILISAKVPNECVMTTFDLEKGVRVTVEAQVIEEGSCIISANKFISTIRAMEEDDIILNVDDRLSVTILCGKSSHTMAALPASDFPEIPRLSSPNGFSLPQNTMKNMMSKCLYAMGVNDQRPVLNGLYVRIEGSHMDMVSCDSFKMAVCGTDTDLKPADGDGEVNTRFIVPNKSVNELFKLLDDKDDEAVVTIYMSRKNIVFDTGSVIFFSKLIEGEYVDYNRILIKNHRVFMYVNRERLISALERAALITEEKVAGAVRSHVKLSLSGDMLCITASSGAGSSYDELRVAHEGEDIVIGFNNRYLLDSLRACHADDVKISMTSPRMAIHIEPAESETEGEDKSGESDLFFLLPIRMQD